MIRHLIYSLFTDKYTIFGRLRQLFPRLWGNEGAHGRERGRATPGPVGARQAPPLPYMRYSSALQMAAATLLPPFLPLATI